jgi:hypothetical protein
MIISMTTARIVDVILELVVPFLELVLLEILILYWLFHLLTVTTFVRVKITPRPQYMFLK